MRDTSIRIPPLVRIKPGALGRVGLYLARAELGPTAVLHSDGMPSSLQGPLREGLLSQSVETVLWEPVAEGSLEEATHLLMRLPAPCRSVVGLGGGRALDVAKYVASLAGKPFIAVPTSLSNDGFCSPQASLTLAQKRRSLPCAMPHGVVVDTTVCLHAPRALWLSGVGDLVAKFTAGTDWKLAFHANGTPVHDLAALLSDATVYQFMAHPHPDEEGIRLLATALMLNGIAMEMAGCSRPASGSEHLISHALDGLLPRPRLHGLQVGLASYVVSHLQGKNQERIGAVLERVGFFELLRQDPIPLSAWREAFQRAPGVKPDFHTVLSARDCTAEMEHLLATDARLRGCVDGSA